MAVYLLLGDDEERKARGVQRLRRGRPIEAHLWRLVVQSSGKRSLLSVHNGTITHTHMLPPFAHASVLGFSACLADED